ncbi:MAG TPA: hypothetical protein VMU75_15640 [Acidimicrobiales bacterium]|nr:hypothetical protein [Acidimicrobiales bacterium]
MGPEESAGIRALEYSELPGELQDAFRSRYERLGYLGGFFRYGSHQPGAILAFHEFTEALKRALPAELSEVVALTVASTLGNRYERHQHERLAIKLGLGRDVVAALVGPEAQPAILDARQLAVRKLALMAVTGAGRDCNSQLEELVMLVGPETAMGVLLLIARYAAHALVANALELQPPVPSIFEQPATDEAAKAHSGG